MWVEYVTVAFVTVVDITFVITARCQCAAGKFDDCDRLRWCLRIPDTDPPRTTVGLWSQHADVPAKVDHRLRYAVSVADFCCTVSGIFLADAAKVEFDAWRQKAQIWRLPYQFIHTKTREKSGHFFLPPLHPGRN